MVSWKLVATRAQVAVISASTPRSRAMPRARSALRWWKRAPPSNKRRSADTNWEDDEAVTHSTLGLAMGLPKKSSACNRRLKLTLVPRSR